MREKLIDYPPWLITGLRFRSHYIFGVITVLDLDSVNNQLHVEINHDQGLAPWCEHWDLQITIWAFENGEYYRTNTTEL
jgi:hypothetical protein